MKPIFINGRFLAQRLAGVQRYATEMSRALVEIYSDRVTILAPVDAASGLAGMRLAGKRTGQAWEQMELPRLAAGGVLVNLGNTAPLAVRRQVVVLHDAGVFSTPEAYSRPFRLWYKALQFGLTRRGATIVTVSEFSRDELVRHLKMPADRIAVVGEGADHMDRIEADPEALAALGLEAGRYVLVVGTLAAHKNLAALGALAEGLTARGMVLAVTGAFGATAFQGGGEGALPRSAKYLGRVSDAALKSLYQQAACYVFPSRYEGFGLPAVEAMACGCAVVAADIPVLHETCGAAAAYCDQASPDSIAQAVLALLDDPTRLASLRGAAQARAAEMTWAKAAAALAAVIEAVPA
jgi:glycosyltransferase involved in cell wall biosynthesis